jgi:hypothetical protein
VARLWGRSAHRSGQQRSQMLKRKFADWKNLLRLARLMRHARIRCDQRWSSLPRQSFPARSLRAVSGAPAETGAGTRTHLTQGFRNRSIVPLCPVARTEASWRGGKESDCYFYLPAGVNYLFVALRFPNWNAECSVRNIPTRER